MSILIIIHVFVQTVHQVKREIQCFLNNENILLDKQYPVAFYSNSYIKRPPLEHTEEFKIEIWFLSESSSGKNLY
jgi:hypothetical protein